MVCVRVEGKGSFLNSTGLKEFSKEMVNRGFREFMVDLEKCPVMDSTFMGTLAGLALRLRELGQGNLRVVNLNERNQDLLAVVYFRLGLYPRATQIYETLRNQNPREPSVLLNLSLCYREIAR